MRVCQEDTSASLKGLSLTKFGMIWSKKNSDYSWIVKRLINKTSWGHIDMKEKTQQQIFCHHLTWWLILPTPSSRIW